MDNVGINELLNQKNPEPATIPAEPTPAPSPSPTPTEVPTPDSSEYLKEFDFEGTPIVDIVNNIILDAIKKGASDIHFDPYEDGIKVRIRIDGDLHDYSTVPLEMKKNLITRIKIISNMNITESRLPQDGAIKNITNDQDVDLRVSCLPTNLGEKLVIRILDYSMSKGGIETLGFTKGNLELVKKMLSMPNGIILVTGATGSGKSTTVYAMLQKLNTENRNIVTVEDPIEMNIDGINQVSVNHEIGMTFQNALRSILRQDPDIIMIGEIRDTETAKISVRSAITGHLVLSTLHTNDSLNTIERLLDMGVERYLLSSAINGIISQRLTRKLCNHCKRKRNTTPFEKEVFKRVLNLDINEIYESVGCEKCNGGYSGRLPIHEVLYLDQVAKDALVNELPKEELRKKVFNNHTQNSTMLEDALIKVLMGETTFDELLRVMEIDEDILKTYSKEKRELETFRI